MRPTAKTAATKRSEGSGNGKQRNIFNDAPPAGYLPARLQRLQFSRCKLVGDKVEFVFHDPLQIGDQAELDFENGECVSAKSLFGSQTYLRRRMTHALDRK